MIILQMKNTDSPMVFLFYRVIFDHEQAKEVAKRADFPGPDDIQKSAGFQRYHISRNFSRLSTPDHNHQLPIL